MKSYYILIVTMLGLILAACGSTSVVASEQTEAQPPAVTPSQTTASSEEETGNQLKQEPGPTELQLSELTDSQGAVTVIVNPLGLDNQDQQLEFEIALETHSVDLSMDLAETAILTTDTGLTIQASEWDGLRGGHHVSGTLSFPASVDGNPILHGVPILTLIIRNVDVPERVFAWDLK
jgi:hypothetical protein